MTSAIQNNYFISTAVSSSRSSERGDCWLYALCKKIFESIGRFFSFLFCCGCCPADPPKRKYLDRKIPKEDLQDNWTRVKPKGRGTNNAHLSHLREVYIGPKSALGKKTVVKISSHVDRHRKGRNNAWPHAEEIAYKINKLFQWTVVPKTKVLHGQDLLRFSAKSKYYKYAAIQQSMVKPSSKQKVREQTFTFQPFVKGKTLPFEGKRNENISKSSFQKTYLLDIILGKDDARSDNIMYDKNTRQLIELDNESLGLTNYSKHGVLREYKNQRKLLISSEILDQVLAVSPTQLFRIQQKYSCRDNHLLDLWGTEQPSSDLKSKEELQEYWETIEENLKILQKSINKLRSTKKKITLDSLENTYKKLR